WLQLLTEKNQQLISSDYYKKSGQSRFHLFVYRLYARQLFAFHVLQQGTPAGTHITHVLGHTELTHRSSRISTTYQRKRPPLCSGYYGISNGSRTFREFIHFKHAHGAVPQDGVGGHNHLGEVFA